MTCSEHANPPEYDERNHTAMVAYLNEGECIHDALLRSYSHSPARHINETLLISMASEFEAYCQEANILPQHYDLIDLDVEIVGNDEYAITLQLYRSGTCIETYTTYRGGEALSGDHASYAEVFGSDTFGLQTNHGIETDESYREGHVGVVNQDKNIYRSSQPTISGYDTLINDYHITNYIVLKHTSKSYLNHLRARESHVVYVPLGSTPPSPDTYEEIKQVYSEGNCLVHCQHGADRTGAVIARLRQDIEGRTLKEALKEYCFYNLKVNPFCELFKKEVIEEWILANHKMILRILYGQDRSTHLSEKGTLYKKMSLLLSM